MASYLLLFVAVFLGFAAMHAVVLAALTALLRWRGAAGPDLTPGRAGLVRALEFVAAESALLTLALASGLVPLAPFALLPALVVPAVSLIWWEVWFYAGHRLLHTRWLYRWHHPHHAEHGVHPSLAFGAGETALLSAGFYLPLAVAARLPGGVSAVTLALTFTAAYVLNVLSHLGPGALGERGEAMLAHLGCAPRYHAAHHRLGRGNYGLVTPWLDVLCGTKVRDEEAPQAPRTARRAPRRARVQAA